MIPAAKSIAAVGFVAALGLSAANAAPILSDSFSYTAGDTLASHGWVQVGFTGTVTAAVADTGLTFPGVTSAGNSATLRGVQMARGITPTGGFYVSALFNQTNPTSAGRVGISLRQTAISGTTNIVAFGLNNTNKLGTCTATSVQTGTWTNSGNSLGTLGTTIMLGAYVDPVAKTLSVWNITDASVPVDPAAPALTIPYTSTNTFGGIAIFYNGNSTTTPPGPILVDEVKVGYTPEDVGFQVGNIPEPAGLALLAGCTLLTLTRRSRAASQH